ncbi:MULTISPECIES: diaminopimelate decarboxylase [unclassified Sphingopyxis]|jgi:diaminopimelate decarboxylase|uniref:diaminopimelate decarboxylase n=1 Tax=unclassified Sphingopyxis TaxID=2614943 RepID=UPI0006BF7D4D|nr:MULTISPECIES: diaminopimelate decarboxylase [unclassified Sphingopyxis]USI75759.1 diaminopimelate decarboxylase [Sphingopyxis sp. USTB-05]GAO77707.1 diaminopimelate decarboxylase [Sphingopyxis sp. C-1]
MNSFPTRGGEIHAEAVSLETIAATVGTPAYVYSAEALRRSAQRFRAALAGVPRKQLMFAVKANPSLAVLRILADQNYGADIVSGGELDCALAAGITANHIVFSGVGKTAPELIAGLDAGIGRFNLELEREGQLLSALAAQRGKRAPTLLRINPDVDASTHAKITTGRCDSKFGVAINEASAMYDRLAALPGLDLHGLAVHIGSQITDLAPLEAAYRKIGELIRALRAKGHRVYHVDLGGGLGVSYRPDQTEADVEAYGAMVAAVTRDWDATLLFEPGRLIAAQAGILLTRVLWVKPGSEHPFVVVDAAMNDLARPALYDAWHEFAAVRPTGDRFVAHIVGPICETGDTFAKARAIDRVGEGDLALFRSAGAYGAAMASTYNCRALVPEVLVDGNRHAVIAERTPAHAVRKQHLAPWMQGAPSIRAA